MSIPASIRRHKVKSIVSYVGLIERRPIMFAYTEADCRRGRNNVDGGSASCGLGLDFYAFLTESGNFDHANDHFALQHVFSVLLSPKLQEIML